MVWQYRTILFEFTKDGLLGDKYVDDEEMEKTLNQLGGKGWELVNVTLLQDGVLAFLKKPAQQERTVEEPVVTAKPAPDPVAPVMRSRVATAPPRISVPEPVFEPQLEPQLEPPPEPAFEPPPSPALHAPRRTTVTDDVPDSIGSIRIS